MSNMTNPSSSYSTIFHCTEDGFTCFLRLCEGLVSLTMFITFAKGYKTLINENNNPISNEDKKLYLLAMAQTFILTLYYFLFEEFFILATIRNLLIWISINILEVFCKIYWIQDDEGMRRVNVGINLLKVINFLTWFVFAVVDGSQLVNTNFNLGYNCRIADWVILSGILLIITLVSGFIGYEITDRLKWEQEQPEIQKDKNKLESIKEQIINITSLTIGQLVGALIMFIWDFIAHTVSTSDEMCQELFSGNTFFRKIFCFTLKIISMQAVPCIIYYIIFYKRRSEFLVSQPRELVKSDADYLNDDAASDLNRTLTSQNQSRGSLFSGFGSTPNL